MESSKKMFWITLAALALGALVCLAGGIIGKSLLGWILFGVGLALVTAVLVWRFKMFKELFTDKRLWTIIGGALVIAMVTVALVVMLVSGSAGQDQYAAGAGGMPPMGTPGAGGQPPAMGQAAATETTAATTAVPTTMATATPEPTATAEVVDSIYVCLNENTRIGYNPRIAPADDALFGGKIDWGSCFYVDGKAAGYPGWYHLTRGQDGTVGVEIDVNEDVYQLWVKGYYLESFGNDLEALPEITVQSN